MLPTKFRFIWQSGFRGEDFQKLTNQKQELPVAAMFVNIDNGAQLATINVNFANMQFPTTGNSGQTQMKIDMKTCVNVLQNNQTVNSM